eukprot:1242432-Rhodomonas_salina.2
MSGTDLAHRTMKYLVRFSVLQCTQKPCAGTEGAYHATKDPVLTSRIVLPAPSRTCVPVTSNLRPPVGPLYPRSYALATRCPVLTFAMLLPVHSTSTAGKYYGLRYSPQSNAIDPRATGLRERFAMSGTDLAYAATGLTARYLRAPSALARTYLLVPTLGDQIQEPTIFVQFVPEKWFLALDFVVYARAVRCPVLAARVGLCDTRY